MAEVVYSTVPGKIAGLLAKIRSTGVPRKADTVWLKASGFTSSNDKTLLPVLRKIDFVDASKAPTPRWRAFRGDGGKAALGQAIRDGYSELYEMYEDAHDRPVSDISNVFKTKSDAGDQAIGKAVATFRALVSEADFSKTSSPAVENNAGSTPSPTQPMKSHGPSSRDRPNLHIDLQVHISPEATADQIDKIFASMAKHLYGQTS